MKVTVIVHPRSKNERITEDLSGTLHVYVNEPALEGKANIAAQEALCKYYDKPKTKILLRYGAKSKLKVFEILKS